MLNVSHATGAKDNATSRHSCHVRTSDAAGLRTLRPTQTLSSPSTAIPTANVQRGSERRARAAAAAARAAAQAALINAKIAALGMTGQFWTDDPYGIRGSPRGEPSFKLYTEHRKSRRSGCLRAGRNTSFDDAQRLPPLNLI